MSDYKHAFVHKRAALRDMPDNFTIELVLGCNIPCRMCPVTYPHDALANRTAATMDPGLFDEILSQISAEPRNLLLNCWGEPTLHPDLPRLVRMAKRHRHRLTLITNGTRLDRDLARELIDADLNVVQFSIDGFHRDAFEAAHPGTRYDAVLDNVRGLIELNKQHHNRMLIEIKHIGSLDAMWQPGSIYNAYHEDVNHIDVSALTDLWGKLTLPGDLRRQLPPACTLPSRRVPCIYLWEAFYITVDGRAMVCPYDFRLESGLPNVRDTPIRRIWTGEIGRFRQWHVDGEFAREPCRSCSRWNVPSSSATDGGRMRFGGFPARLRRWLGAGAAAGPFGAVDGPAPDEAVCGPFDVLGWALARTGRKVRTVDIRIDGHSVAAAKYGFLRPDVALAYPQHEDGWFSAFSCRIDSAPYEAGRHTVEAIATDDAGVSAPIGTTTVTIKPGRHVQQPVASPTLRVI